MKKRPLIILTGPTAVGKTSLSIELAKEFNQYYHDTPILREENQELLQYRLVLVETIAKVLGKAMSILGITLPERMQS